MIAELKISILILGFFLGLILWALLVIRRHKREQDRQLQCRQEDLKEKFLEETKALKSSYSAANTWQRFKDFKVIKKHVESWTEYKGKRISDICSFIFAPNETPLPLPSFFPGQHLSFDLTLENGNHKTMYYSLSDGPNEQTFRVSIKRALPPPRNPDAPPGLGSNFFHDHIHEGDLVKTALPKGDFFLDTEKQAHNVLVAGGIGITPMISMARKLCDMQSSNPVSLYYGVRHMGEIALVDDLVQLSEKSRAINIYLCLSDPQHHSISQQGSNPSGMQASDELRKLSRLSEAKNIHFITTIADGGEINYCTNGPGARVSVALMKQQLDPSSEEHQFYLCGPPPMMSSVVTDLYHWNMRKEQVHWEGFGPCAVMWPGDILNSPLKPCSITFFELKSDLKTFIDWQVADGSIMNLADANSKVKKIPRSCGAGWCGTCKSSYKGSVHYDSPPGYSNLRDNECLPCVCKPQGDLVINLKS